MDKFKNEIIVKVSRKNLKEDFDMVCTCPLAKALQQYFGLNAHDITVYYNKAYIFTNNDNYHYTFSQYNNEKLRSRGSNSLKGKLLGGFKIKLTLLNKF